MAGRNTKEYSWIILETQRIRKESRAGHLHGIILDRDVKMASSCEDYRFQQQLLALRKRLAEEKLDQEDREELEKLIQELENRLKM